jgi:hypothetical protein
VEIEPVVDDPPSVEDGDDDIAVHHHHRHRRLGRRATRMLVIIVVAAVAGGGVWWHRAVTADPGLSFDGGPNVFRNADGGDITGITRAENSFGTDVNVAYEAGAPLHGFFGLYNHGHHTVTIQGVRPRRLQFWAFDGAALSRDWRTVLAGRDYGPFRPFRLRPGETRFLRLDFHTASCDPAGLQKNGSSRIVAVPVRYRTLGVTRTATVPFDQVSIGIETMGICDQPLR